MRQRDEEKGSERESKKEKERVSKIKGVCE
jgi:hypothetical protein